MMMMHLFNMYFLHPTNMIMILATMSILNHGTLVTAQTYTNCVVGNVDTSCVVNAPSPLVLNHPSGPVQFGSQSFLAVTCLNDVPISLTACVCIIAIDIGSTVETSDYCNSCILSAISDTSVTVASWDCSNRFVGECVALASDLSCISNVNSNGNAPTVPPVTDTFTLSPTDPSLTTTPPPVSAPTDPPFTTTTQPPEAAPMTPPFTTTQPHVPAPTDPPLTTTDEPTLSPDTNNNDNNSDNDVPTATTNTQPVFAAPPISSPIAKPAASPSDSAQQRDTSGTKTKYCINVVVSMIFTMTIVQIVVTFLM